MPLFTSGFPGKLARRRRFFKSRSLVDCRADEKFSIVRHKPNEVASWVTRERPKIDRIACPWLIKRFIDKDPEFLFVPAPRVLAMATQTGAVPYDVPDVELTHVGEHCSFDAFFAALPMTDPGLTQLAVIVRGADTGRPELAPQAAGLLAVSLGLSAIFADDHELLQQGMVI